MARAPFQPLEAATIVTGADTKWIRMEMTDNQTGFDTKQQQGRVNTRVMDAGP